MSISDSTLVSFDGLYDIIHTDGHASETNTLLICHVKYPSSGHFVSGSSPFIISSDNVSTGLTIDLNAYTMTVTTPNDCGTLVYTASTTSGYDPFPGNGSISTTQLTFSNFGDWPIGITVI